ncbi:hypothetical protein [Metamycoplasma hyosynoviae]|uniref:Glutamyl-tRNA amidotransferase n=1 Tax=Metamycoplasma hyosynoviae TaxID=29559 RepID=A0A063YD48_9BACT|nr:hypothetical protein [Metamycoplasma hyosynoviae]ASI54122.1 hypothetical protein MHSN_03005 [Metamycoplasma hyosynoviae]KDE42012.1 glutamyl-tRNA amidotransferase [Metamycoplasma hyosynoviae]KDE42465.1 glutamyl-tRNA amidotransferase [Metamycoplasma hyosynoviae]KDE42600.1 glutamyl-tRNA amidotransferase [Metamycoplasma hyosynoviae]KDE43085.1 glutamyl-tRNA amidotransferase [Metamycoplasma hyosynoviae]
MNEEKIKKLAKDIYLKPSKEVISLTLDLYSKVENGLLELEQFKDEIVNLKPLHKISETPLEFSLLRKDEENSTFLLKREEILANATSKTDSFVSLKKVLNDN